jgi:ABC-2 type transport system permease protein
VSLIAGALGILFTMILVRIFPAQRTRDVVMLLGVCGLGALYTMFRLLRPERLVDPDAFFSIAQYMAALQGPDSPYLPTHWMTETLWAYLSHSSGKDILFHSGLVWSTAGALTAINVWVAEAIYFSGFSKAQEAKRRRAARRLLDFFVAVIKRPFKPQLAAIIDKDLRVFFRDNPSGRSWLHGAWLVYFPCFLWTRAPFASSSSKTRSLFLMWGLPASFYPQCLFASFSLL